MDAGVGEQDQRGCALWVLWTPHGEVHWQVRLGEDGVWQVERVACSKYFGLRPRPIQVESLTGKDAITWVEPGAGTDRVQRLLLRGAWYVREVRELADCNV